MNESLAGPALHVSPPLEIFFFLPARAATLASGRHQVPPYSLVTRIGEWGGGTVRYGTLDDP